MKVRMFWRELDELQKLEYDISQFISSASITFNYACQSISDGKVIVAIYYEEEL